MTSAARDLMDTGTPGPWQAGHHLALTTEIVPEIIASATQLGGIFDQERNEADARKIVLSVNALPLVDALCEVINNIEAGADGWGACSCEWVQINLLTGARDALEAALRGEGE